MLSENQEMIYQHVRFRFGGADEYEHELKAVINKNFISAEDLNVETTAAVFQQIYQNISHEEHINTRDMFKAAFLFMVSYYWHQQLSLDMGRFVEEYPHFGELHEGELQALLDFRNMLRVAMLIFDPHESKDDFMSVLCGVCGVTESYLVSQPGMAARFLQVFDQEIAIPHQISKSLCTKPQLELRGLQARWGEEDQDEWIDSDASTTFWHNHCLQMLTGRDIPSVEVPLADARGVSVLPSHDLDWSAPAPEYRAQAQWRPTNLTPLPPQAGDYYTNYAAQLVRFAQRQTQVYQSGFIPYVEPVEPGQPIQSIQPMIVSQHTSPQHSQQPTRSGSDEATERTVNSLKTHDICV